jgi:SM-20-related protein
MRRVALTTDVGDVDAQKAHIAVVDDVLPDERRREVNNFLHEGGWRFGWKSDPRKDFFSFWHKHFAGNRNPDNYDMNGAEKQYECAAELHERAAVIYALWNDLAHGVLEGHALVRCYANGAPFGSEGTLHTDSTSPQSYTAIYYPHKKWFPNWGGETVFFNSAKDDIIASIYPRPNRLILFSGIIPHIARGVARSCPNMRITLMFKTEFQS